MAATALTRSYPYDSQTAAEDAWREMFTGAWGHGVIAGVGDELLVSPGVGRQFSVGSGQLLLAGAFGAQDGDVTVDLPANASGQPMYFRAIARNHFANNRIEFDYLAGSPNANPVLPTLTQNTSMWEVGLGAFYAASGYSGVASGLLSATRRLIPPGGGVAEYDNLSELANWVTPSIGDAAFVRGAGLYIYSGTAWNGAGSRTAPARQFFTGTLSNGTSTAWAQFLTQDLILTAPYPLTMIVRVSGRMGNPSSDNAQWMRVAPPGGGSSITQMPAPAELLVTGVTGVLQPFALLGVMNYDAGQGVGFRLDYRVNAFNLFVDCGVEVEFVPRVT